MLQQERSSLRLQTAILNKDFSALCDSGTEADEIIHIEQKVENLKWSKNVKEEIRNIKRSFLFESFISLHLIHKFTYF